MHFRTAGLAAGLVSETEKAVDATLGAPDGVQSKKRRGKGGRPVLYILSPWVTYPVCFPVFQPGVNGIKMAKVIVDDVKTAKDNSPLSKGCGAVLPLEN